MRYLQRGVNGGNPADWMKQNRVNLAGVSEVIYEPLYDTATYPAAGTTSITLFQNQIGKNGKTLKDTNMDLDGQLPAGKMFLVTGIQLAFYSQDSSGKFVENDGSAINFITRDVRTFAENGHLILRIQSKDYLRQAPLGKFPPVEKVDGFSSVSMDNSTFVNTHAFVEHVAPAGREFSINGLLLESNQNFSIELRDLPALPSGVDGKIVCTLNGFIARNAQ
jgi:hypothetical protein